MIPLIYQNIQLITKVNEIRTHNLISILKTSNLQIEDTIFHKITIEHENKSKINRISKARINKNNYVSETNTNKMDKNTNILSE